MNRQLNDGDISAFKENDSLKMSSFLARETEIQTLRDICKSTDISKAVLIRVALEKTYGVTTFQPEINARSGLTKEQLKKLDKLLSIK